MADEYVIKIDEDGFNDAITKLNEYKEILVKAKDAFITINSGMKKDWLGDGSTAFSLSSKSLEKKFNDKIDDLTNEIQYIINSKDSILSLDNQSSNTKSD